MSEDEKIASAAILRMCQMILEAAAKAPPESKEEYHFAFWVSNEIGRALEVLEEASKHLGDVRPRPPCAVFITANLPAPEIRLVRLRPPDPRVSPWKG